jgi:hypothetical protein
MNDNEKALIELGKVTRDILAVAKHSARIEVVVGDKPGRELREAFEREAKKWQPTGGV